MKKVIIFNGPPRSGKDTACNYLKEKLGDKARIVGFKDPLIELTARFYGLTTSAFLQQYDERFSADFWYKDVSRSWLGGQSQRQALIHVSENVVKPVFGDNVFGDALVHKIESDSEHDLFLVPGSGFESELLPLCHCFDVTVVKICRSDCNFDGDSRSYLKAWDYKIKNNGTIGEFEHQMNIVSMAEELEC